MYTRILIGVFNISAFLIVIIAVFHFIAFKQDIPITLDEQKLFLEYYRYVGFGFIIALLGILIPHLLANEQYKNQQFKESKLHYSKAKTEIIYLREEIAQLNYIDAIKKIKEVHQQLHLAETYPKELIQHLQWIHPYQHTWVDRNYWEITLIRKMLNKRIENWNNLTIIEREQEIQDVLNKVGEVFGFNNEVWYKDIYLGRSRSEWYKIKFPKEKKLIEEF